LDAGSVHPLDEGRIRADLYPGQVQLFGSDHEVRH
jgi:hypothetical protein